MTKRQGQVLGFLREFIGQKGYAPSHEEIAVAMGLTSLATVNKHLNNLQYDGFITRQHNRARSILLAEGAGACSKCGRAFA